MFEIWKGKATNETYTIFASSSKSSKSLQLEYRVVLLVEPTILGILVLSFRVPLTLQTQNINLAEVEYVPRLQTETINI